MISIWHYDTPIGTLWLEEDGEALTHLYFHAPHGLENAVEQETPLLSRAGTQLAEYFGGKRTAFDLPLAPNGTAFQQAVWSALLGIPYGATASYKQIAEQLGRTSAVRAVGMANRVNPLPIFIPCHRVIGQDGSLTGYAGGLSLKAALLELEAGKEINNR